MNHQIEFLSAPTKVLYFNKSFSAAGIISENQPQLNIDSRLLRRPKLKNYKTLFFNKKFSAAGNISENQPQLNIDSRLLRRPKLKKLQAND